MYVPVLLSQRSFTPFSATAPFPVVILVPFDLGVLTAKSEGGVQSR
jgi:hypothetical protein